VNICSKYRREGRLSGEDLKAASYDELLDLKVLVDENTAQIREQLDSAKSDAAATGIYADRNWFRSATAAMRIKGQLGQRIQNEIRRKKQLEKEERQMEQHDREWLLMRAMDEVLTSEQKQRVVLKVAELQGVSTT